jgi:putative ABC transport system permease protein
MARRHLSRCVAVGILSTLAIGAVAGIYPAIRAARTPPTAALSS